MQKTITCSLVYSSEYSWQVYGHDRHTVFTVLFYPLCWLNVSVFLLLMHFAPRLRKCLEVKSFVALGDISLAMYLLHVPLQITLLFILRLFHVAVPYGSPWFLLTYAGILVVLSRIVYRYFEMPMQARLREKLCR